MVRKNLSNIAYDCGVRREFLSCSDAKQMRYWSIPAQERWRSSLLLELLEVRSQRSEVMSFDREEIEAMITHICSC